MVRRSPYDLTKVQRLSYNRMFILVEVQQLLHYLEFSPQLPDEHTPIVHYTPTPSHTTPQKKPRDSAVDVVSTGPDDADSVFSPQFVSLICPYLQRVVDTLSTQRLGKDQLCGIAFTMPRFLCAY